MRKQFFSAGFALVSLGSVPDILPSFGPPIVWKANAAIVECQFTLRRMPDEHSESLNDDRLRPSDVEDRTGWAWLEIYSGPEPLRITEPNEGIRLCTFSFDYARQKFEPCTVVDASGIGRYFRIKDARGRTLRQGSIGDTVGEHEMFMDNTCFVADGIATISG